MEIVGHEWVRHRLESMPPVVLIEGPEGVGKRLIAREAAERVAKPHEVIEVGVSVCTQSLAAEGSHRHQESCEVMTARVAQYVIDRCRVRSAGRAVVFDAGKATTEAANALLKVLEEPPPRTWFVMHASKGPLLTIVSRAEHMWVQPLSAEEVADIVQRQGSSPEAAWLAARLSGGRPGRAILLEKALAQRAVVAELLKAAVDGDRNSLARTLDEMNPKSDEEWAEHRRQGELTKARQVVEVLRIALREVRLGKHVVLEPVRAIEALEPVVIDRAMVMAGRNVRSVLVIRSVTEFLMGAVGEVRRKSGGLV